MYTLKSEINFVLKAFVFWRVGLFLILYFAVLYLPNQIDFVGGGLANYIKDPMFWAWANFDGQHYLNIAQNGYGNGEYTFFPFYPLILITISTYFGRSLASLNLIGQIVSNVSFLIALLGFYKLCRIDFSEKITKLSVILLLLFPTSFYFAAVYTESLFFMLLVWSFYCFRTKYYKSASLLGVLLTFTRPVGIFIFPAYLIEWVIENRKFKGFPKTLFTIPLGLVAYISYLKIHINNAIAFFSEQSSLGEHRSDHIITIPQVIYRYVFKIIPNINTSNFFGTFFVFLEFLIGVFYLVFLVVLFFVSRPSYIVFAISAYITPTFLGSFSSMPRYVLIIFPVYFVLSLYLSRSKIYVFAFCLLSFILLVICFSMFARGYWIS